MNTPTEPNPLENRLRSWKPRPPSGGLEEHIFGRADLLAGQDAPQRIPTLQLANPWQRMFPWSMILRCAPVAACLVLSLFVWKPGGTGVGALSATNGMTLAMTSSLPVFSLAFTNPVELLSNREAGRVSFASFPLSPALSVGAKESMIRSQEHSQRIDLVQASFPESNSSLEHNVWSGWRRSTGRE